MKKKQDSSGNHLRSSSLFISPTSKSIPFAGLLAASIQQQAQKTLEEFSRQNSINDEEEEEQKWEQSEADTVQTAKQKSAEFAATPATSSANSAAASANNEETKV